MKTANRIVVIAFALAATLGLPALKASADPATASAAEEKVSADRYRVRVSGAEGMGAEEVRNQAMLRAAQVTLDHGATWFEILRRPAAMDFGADYAVASRACNAMGCALQAAPVTAGELKPVFGHAMEIVIGSGEQLEGAASKSYDARQLISQFSTKIS
jgi:hypothetical protein